MHQPDIRPVKENGDVYRLHDDYVFEFKGQHVIVDAGFRHDGATRAKLLFGRDGIHRAAALVHDYLYAKRGQLTPVIVYTRKDADRKFKEMLLEAGVKSWHVNVAYAVVRVAGWFFWRSE